MFFILIVLWLITFFSEDDPGMIGHLGFLAIYIFGAIQIVIEKATKSLENKIYEAIKAVKAQSN